jgi:DnaJ-class molecular chaperone
MKNNPWNALGVSQKASPEQIKNAYRKLVALHHPDRGGDKDKFHEIQMAYDILSDPVKRSEFEKKLNEKPITKLSQTVREVVDEFWEGVTSNHRK